MHRQVDRVRMPVLKPERNLVKPEIPPDKTREP